MSYTIVKPKDRDEWLVERQKGIGSSDAGTLMGVSPFSTPLKLWRLRLGIDPPIEETDAMRNGHYFESSTAQYFAAATNSFVDPDTADDWLAVSNEKPYLRVSPDRLFWNEGVEHKPENALILELKSTSKLVDPENLPPYWFCQVQYQMGVMGVPMAAIAWISAYPNLHFGHQWVPFNPNFYKMLVDKIDHFWNENIIKGVEPEPMTEQDADILWPKVNNANAVTATEEDKLLVEEYKELSERIKESEEELSKIAMQIKEKIQDNDSLVYQNTDGTRHTLVTYRHNRKNIFDADRFRKEKPDMFKKYSHSVLDIDELKSFDKKTWAEYNEVTQGKRVFKIS